ncbi:MAG: hypothetical protein HYY11_03030 [Candidatus Methylomirabilis oxyfera]|nr:hypothetical protein [Candidatus Methylomirabilis oxyfera]
MTACQWVGADVWVTRRSSGAYVARLGGRSASSVVSPAVAARALAHKLCPNHRLNVDPVSVVGRSPALSLWEIIEEETA